VTGTGRQRGVALITVMVVVAIVVGIAAAMLRDHQLDIRRAENVLHGNQAIFHLLALETWAREILLEDREDGSVDHAGEDWARVLLPVEADGGVVAGRILDQQGLFNLNMLIDGEGNGAADAMAAFKRLIEIVAPDTTNPGAIVEAAVDWMDANQEITGLGGAEDPDYAVLDPAYRTAGRLLVSPSELRLVQGVGHELWQQLRPFVTALPKGAGGGAVNVNTAPAEVLQSVANIDSGLAETIVAEREDDPFDSTEAFNSRLQRELTEEELAALNFERFTTASDYFLVESEARFANVALPMRHLIARHESQTRVLLRALGTTW